MDLREGIIAPINNNQIVTEIHRNKNGKENEIQELVATTVNNSAGTRMKNQKLEEI